MLWDHPNEILFACVAQNFFPLQFCVLSSLFSLFHTLYTAGGYFQGAVWWILALNLTDLKGQV